MFTLNLYLLQRQKIFTLFLAFIFAININFIGTASAQTATGSPYSTATSIDQARKQCNSVIKTFGISAVFNDDGSKAIIAPQFKIGSPGRSNVPSEDRGVFSQLTATNQNLGEILRVLIERNFSEDCFKVLSLAKANKAITKVLSESQKKIVNEDLNNPNETIKKSKNKIIEDDIEKNKKSNSPYKDSISNAYSILTSEKTKPKVTLSPTDVEERATGKKIVTMDDFDEMIVEGNNPTAKALEAINQTGNKVAIETTNIYEDSRYSGGLSAARYCTDTFSGADPENIKWNDKDCKKSNKEPIIISQERVKQIINAPYNQAFSPSAALGLDPALNNINIRINTGKLFEKGINENFGKSTDRVGGDINDIKAIKEALIGNATGTVSLGIEIQKAVNNLYTSSTSSCRFISIIDRAIVITETNTQKLELENYKIDLTAKWTEVINNPNRDYTNLFIKLGLDLSNKYSKEWLTRIFSEARVKLGKCTTAASNATGV